MKYSLLTYQEGRISFNIGDYIQSLAARQFLPSVDLLLNREKLSEYNGAKTKLIMNGWFTHNARHWIPSDSIYPLYVSFHINSTTAKEMLSEKGIAHLKKYEPIGCRDFYTVNLLKDKGIDAYFTGCLTLTLDNYKVDDCLRGDEIYIVDPLFTSPHVGKEYFMRARLFKSALNFALCNLNRKNQLLASLIDDEVLENRKFVKQELSANNLLDEQKFVLAEDLLHRYARAKLVITSRIHCALPCLALGTPVIFINGFTSLADSCRFEGIFDLLNRIDINTRTGEFSTNFPLDGKIHKNTIVKNFEKHHNLANSMKNKCQHFIET